MFQRLISFLFDKKREVPVPKGLRSHDSSTGGYFAGDTAGSGSSSHWMDDNTDCGNDASADCGGDDGGGDGGGGD